MKLAFVYHHDRPDYWRDGLYTAMKLVENFHTVTYVNLWQGDAIPECDFILGWGAFGSPVDKAIHGLETKKGLCIAGNAFPPDTALDYDVLFYETKWYRPQIMFHPNIVHAFGINGQLFNRNDRPAEQLFDLIGIGAFANWKRWELFKNRSGLRVVIGQIQKDNMIESMNIAYELVRAGIGVLDEVYPEKLSAFYANSKAVYIPSSVIGGGERAVLEARACGCEIYVEDDNPKLKELTTCEIYDHDYYANQLIKGIDSV